MTPFGDRMRKLRAERGITLKEMADGLGVSSAYLSALEHGKRGRPGWHLIQRILTLLQHHMGRCRGGGAAGTHLSSPNHHRYIGAEPEATELANRLADDIGRLDPAALEELLAVLDRKRQKPRG